MTGDKAENYKKPPRTLIDLVDSDDKLVDDDSVAPVECNEEGLHEGDETNDNMQIEVNVSLEESVRLLEQAAAEQAREQWKKMYPKEYAKRQRDEEKKRKAEICRAKKAAQIQARELINMAIFVAVEREARGPDLLLPIFESFPAPPLVEVLPGAFWYDGR